MLALSHTRLGQYRGRGILAKLLHQQAQSNTGSLNVIIIIIITGTIKL